MAHDRESWPHLRVALGFVIMLSAHTMIVWSHVVLDDVRGAVVASAAAPALEGRIVAITAPLVSSETISDAGMWSKEDVELLIPASFVVIDRIVETPYKDADDFLEWREAEALGPLSAGRRFASEASVGGLRFAPENAFYSSLLPLGVGPEEVRIGTAEARGFQWDQASHAFYVPSAIAPGDEMDVDEPRGRFTGRVRFEGYSSAQTVTVVGRQVDGTLAPIAIRGSSRPQLVVVPGTATPAGVVAAIDKAQHAEPLRIGLCFIGGIGLALMLLRPLAAIAAFVTCGWGSFFANLAGGRGLRRALPHLGLTLFALGSASATWRIAESIHALWANVLWLVVLGAGVLALRRAPGFRSMEADSAFP